MITVQKVKKIFSTKNGEVTAVNDINIDINKGEIFGVIGYSGAGKSTLIRMLNGLEIPTSGKISCSWEGNFKYKGCRAKKSKTRHWNDISAF